MADDETQDAPADPGQSALQTSSATANAADQPTVATSFHLFAFLPEEIRRMIWRYACFSMRIHFFEFPCYCLLPPVGALSDPAQAPLQPYYNVLDDLAMLIANSENFTQQWVVPGPHRLRQFYWRRDLSRVGSICPEAREAYLSLVNEQSRLTIKKNVTVNDSIDVFHFPSPSHRGPETPLLLNMRPRLSPTNIATNIEIGTYRSNFKLLEGGKRAEHKLPQWLLKAIQWGREAKEGHKNSPATSLTPSIDDVMINLQNLQTFFLIDDGIKLRQRTLGDVDEQPSNGGNSSASRGQANLPPLAHQYSVLIHGMHRKFYGINPENEAIMKNWTVPKHVWPVLEETKRVIGSSDVWKVKVYLMVAGVKKTRKRRPKLY